MPLDHAIFGEGIYTPREAARLLGTTPQEILRWTRGSGSNDPLWHAYYQFLDDGTELSFSDLIEVRVVRALRRAGISLQAIRFAMNLASEKFDLERPLVSRHFKTDGQEILMSAAEDDGDFISLSNKRPGQKVFADIVRQSLQDLEYEGEQVARWRPGNAKHIVIDPTRSFGSPILDSIGISSRLIFQDFENFGDLRYLSSIYEAPISEIRDAVQYEKHLDSLMNEGDGKGSI